MKMDEPVLALLRELNFRFGLVRVRENTEAIALISGEADERRRLSNLVVAVKAAWQMQTSGLARIQVFTTVASTSIAPTKNWNQSASQSA